MILVEIGNQRTELVDKTIDLIARKFSEIFDNEIMWWTVTGQISTLPPPNRASKHFAS